MTTLTTSFPLSTSKVRVQCGGMRWKEIPMELDPSVTSFLNRPFVHHLVDYLVEQGVRSIEFAVMERLDQYREILGSGERWGMEFSYVEDRQASQKPSMAHGCKHYASHVLPVTSEISGSTYLVRVDSPKNFLAAQEHVMSRDLESMITVERELQPGIWVGRNVSIHSSAKLVGPLLIGDNTRICAGATVGPLTVIGPNCMIDRNTFLQRSTVLPNVYVGEALDAKHSIIGSQAIINVRLGAALRVKDDLLVSRFPW